MKRYFITLFIVCSVFCTATAQKIGHFSFEAVIKAMPRYAVAQEDLARMRQQYADELKLSEQDFSDKYEMFMEQLADMAPSIKEKRQAELQDMYKRNVKFRADSEKLLKQTEHDIMVSIKATVKDAIAEVGKQGDYLMVVNTDSDACPYIDPASAVDVTNEIIRLAK